MSAALARPGAAPSSPAWTPRMSTYRPRRRTCALQCEASPPGWFDASSETVTVVEQVLEAWRRSGGAFDPTVGPAVDLWGFGPGAKDRADRRRPTAIAASSRRSVPVGSRPAATPRGLRKRRPGRAARPVRHRQGPRVSTSLAAHLDATAA